MKIDSLSDPELVELLNAGQEQAFKVLYERYWNKLYVIARHRLNDTAEAEEVVQEIFLKLWRRRAALVLTHGFDNYFAVAVKFEVLNRLAKRARVTAYERAIARDLSQIEESVLDALDYSELQARFEIAVDALPEKCRIVFRLKHEKGYSQKEIADELGISEKTVEGHLTKARKNLRDRFGDKLGLLL